MEFATTPSQTVGPYFRIGLTEKHSVKCLAGPDAAGERVWLICRVLDGDGSAVNDAMIEIWQADSQGKYNHPEDRQEKIPDSSCRGFGRLGTEEDGSCEFETVKPGRVPGPGDILQAPHFNVAVYARGILLQLYTRIYFEGEPANIEDPVLASVPAERRDTLMASRDGERPGHWRFDIHLCGRQETVFFDV
jgi:protocatechuate 3,4-dioxygenase, alpha subunit